MNNGWPTMDGPIMIIRKEMQFEGKEPMNMDSNPNLSRTLSKGAEKTSKKGPCWMLSQDVKMELDPQGIAKKF